MKVISLIFSCFFSLTVFSQDALSIQFQELFTEIDSMPYYEGGQNEMLTVFEGNSTYKFNLKRNKESFVSLNFIVDKEGKVHKPKILFSTDKKLGIEVSRLILLTKWQPGIRKGKNVNVSVNLLINEQ